MPAKHPLKSDIYMNKNGTPNKGNLYKKLRQSRLKECHIVRYADDFKIFCKSYSDAVKLKHAVEQWLMDRLKLETSPDKSRITNLTKGYSDFLGIKFKLYKKGKKWSIKVSYDRQSHQSQQTKLKNAMLKPVNLMRVNNHSTMTSSDTTKQLLVCTSTITWLP